MSFSSELRDELLELKVWDVNSNLKQEEQIARICLREAFIKNGFMNNPYKDYHLEISTKTLKRANELLKLFNNFKINAKITKKGNGYIVYMKDGNDIVNFLALVGANKTVLRFEEIRVEKDAQNNINRILNCETANLTKTIETATLQIENIKFLKQKGAFKKLPEHLKNIAEIRLKNPDASYEELGEMLEKKIGKSGVSHRLSKINEIANELRNTK